MKLGYIVHNLNDPAVERRCEMLTRGGIDVVVAGFCRDPNLSPAIAKRRPLVIGQSADAAMLQRAVSTMQHCLFNANLTHYFADCGVIMARNLEQLAIASRLAKGRPLVYECLDIHRSLVGDNMPSRAIQFLEARLLPHVDLLLTSSPAFTTHHFSKRPVNCDIRLIENKLLVTSATTPKCRPAPLDIPLRIGWFGMLRCRTTLAFLTDLAEKADGKIEILICGKPSPAELPNLERDVAHLKSVRFTGPYNYADLPTLYGQCHFAWTIDWFEEGLNSSWLLPNRLYEALSHGAIPIALRDIELGNWLHANQVGFLVKSSEEAKLRLLDMTLPEVSALQEQVLRVDPRKLLADDADCQELALLLTSMGPQ